MLEDLGKLLQAVQGHYDYICGLWCGQRKTDINLKKETGYGHHKNARNI